MKKMILLSFLAATCGCFACVSKGTQPQTYTVDSSGAPFDTTMPKPPKFVEPDRPIKSPGGNWDKLDMSTKL